jgi:hypothetical protein
MMVEWIKTKAALKGTFLAPIFLLTNLEERKNKGITSKNYFEIGTLARIVLITSAVFTLSASAS